MAILNWLHLSDWHQGGGDFDRQVVVRALMDDINKRAEIDPVLEQIDCVFFTGDLAFSGKKAEYESARNLLLEPVCAALDVRKERLFLIPGNHDLDRSKFKLLPPDLMKSFASSAKANEWLIGEEERSVLLTPFSAYQTFISEYGVPGFSGFGDSHKITVHDQEIGIVGMNSALMCGRPKYGKGEEADYGKLFVGEPQIIDPLHDVDKAQVRIALIHHPFEWLHTTDRGFVEARLLRGCDFILRGHVHQQGIQQIASTEGDCVIVRGGTCYNGRIPDRPQYMNAYNYVSYDTDTRQGTVYLRRWNLDNSGWTEDTDRSKEGKYPFSTGTPITPPLPPSSSTPSVATLQDVNVLTEGRWANARNKYLDYLSKQCEYINPRGIAQTENTVTLPLDAVYVSLRAEHKAIQYFDEAVAKISFTSGTLMADAPYPILSAATIETQTVESGAKSWRFNVGKPQPEVIMRKVELYEIVQRERLTVLLGAPGAGKTTMTRFVTACFVAACRNNLSDVTDAAGNRYGGIRLPILLRVASYAKALDTNYNLSLREFLSQPFKDTGIPDRERAEFFETALQQGRALVLLDGLDEVATGADRAHIARQIESFISGLEANCRVLVTSRIVGYREAHLTGAFAEYQMLDMDDGQIKEFLNRWCVEVEKFQTPNAGETANQNKGQEESLRLQQAIARSEGVRKLATNPLLLTILALIHRNQKHLPERRVELYCMASDTLLREWQTAQTEMKNVEVTKAEVARLLEPLAYQMHNTVETGLLDREEARRLLCEFDATPRRLSLKDPDVQERVDGFLTRVQEHSGLLVMHSTGKVGFLHLTFQEYFAARYLVNDFDEAKKLLRLHRHKARWEEPLRLAIATQTGANAAKLIRAALWHKEGGKAGTGYAPSEYEDILHRDLLLTARCLGDCADIESTLAREIADELTAICLNRTVKGPYEPLRKRILATLSGLASGEIGQGMQNQLLDALRDQDWNVRWNAASALGQVGQGSEAVLAALLAALRDQDGNVRDAAWEALWTLTSENASISATLSE